MGGGGEGRGRGRDGEGHRFTGYHILNMAWCPLFHTPAQALPEMAPMGCWRVALAGVPRT